MDPSAGTEKYYRWFYGFVEKFKNEDEEIKNLIHSRIIHTNNVIKNIRDIYQKNYPVNPLIDLQLLEITALFHDVGRFARLITPDISCFRSGDDHAELGVNLLKEMNVLDDLTERKRDLILNAIFFHNKKGLHLKCGDEVIIELTEMLRTADKMDIKKNG